MPITKKCVVIVMAVLVATTAFAAPSKDEAKRLNEAATVITGLRTAGDSGIPDDIWKKADCVVVIPSLKKAGFIIGGEFGSGVMSCRNRGAWGPPVFMQLSKGSAGFQVGAQVTELVLIVRNRQGAEKLLGNKATLGADASIAAGPVGRTAAAATDAQMSAEMLSYSHSKGLFAGIDLSGGSLRPDDSANARTYGPIASAREIAFGEKRVMIPQQARSFMNALGSNVRATTGVK